MEKADILNILRSKSSVLTFKEIVLASGEKKPNLLKRRLSYYIQKGELYSIRRGLYAKDKNYDKLDKIFIATYQTKEIECDKQSYSFRKIKDIILTNSAGIENRGNYFAATKERAFLDVLYLNKDYYFDNLSPLDLSKIRELLPIYQNKRMVKRVENYFNNLKADGE
jgi:hypothetical protein